MNVFNLRNQLIADYSQYVRSYIQIRDERISSFVSQRLDEGMLWPEPLIQLNPAFEPGAWIDDLVNDGVLHAECSKIFRKEKNPTSLGEKMRLHRHQEDAARVAQKGVNYVLTTGTGSGKSLAYIVPIVDHVLRRGSGRGIQAIIVYPMNALANSQNGELTKFLCYGYPDQPPVRFAQYTGQEDDAVRDEIVNKPPDILLTNYVMLEYILTRPFERKLIEAAKGLRFLVLDELHTYRGRQGADVAMLVRRVKWQKKHSGSKICLEPLIRARALKCPLVLGKPVADDSAEAALKIEEQVEALGKVIAARRKEKHQADNLVQERIAEEKRAQAAFDVQSKRFTAEREALIEQRLQWRNLIRQANQAKDDESEATRLEQSLTNLEKDIRKSQERQADLRAQQKKTISSFSETYERIVKAVLGAEVSASVQFSGRRIDPKVNHRGDLTSVLSRP